MIIVLYFLKSIIGPIEIIFQILIVIFNLTILCVSFRENEKALLNSHLNVLNEKNNTLNGCI